MNRIEILDIAGRAVVTDRATTHGDVEGNFVLIAKYWSAHTGADIGPCDVAAMMALFKIARIKSNPGHADNWIDLAGYAACGGEVALP